MVNQWPNPNTFACLASCQQSPTGDTIILTGIMPGGQEMLNGTWGAGMCELNDVLLSDQGLGSLVLGLCFWKVTETTFTHCMLTKTRPSGCWNPCATHLSKVRQKPFPPPCSSPDNNNSQWQQHGATARGTPIAPTLSCHDSCLTWSQMPPQVVFSRQTGSRQSISDNRSLN